MLASEVLKRQRAARICTHDGAFHCDEALACFLLSRTRTFRDNYTIVRTRDVSVIEDEATDVVVDVGGVFDAGRLRFDHHQRSFDEVFGHGFNTKLSSAGLVYREFGKEVRVMMTCDESNQKILMLMLIIMVVVMVMVMIMMMITTNTVGGGRPEILAFGHRP